MTRFSTALLAAALIACCPAASASAAGTGGRLRAGAGQADITPPKTGYFLGGWTRSDRLLTARRAPPSRRARPS